MAGMSSATRDQILDATVHVIAREGSHGLSFAKVVKQAGLSSTRLVSYHFGTREALLEAAFARVLARAAEFMSPRIAAATSIRGKIAAYISSNLEFLAEDIDGARAAIDLAAALGGSANPEGLTLLEQGFAAGQATGELRAFDAHAMAVALRGAIDASVLDMVDGKADPRVAADELVELFDRAIRA